MPGGEDPGYDPPVGRVCLGILRPALRPRAQRYHGRRQYRVLEKLLPLSPARGAGGQPCEKLERLQPKQAAARGLSAEQVRHLLNSPTRRLAYGTTRSSSRCCSSGAAAPSCSP
jgi:hypothetical protein